MSDEQTRPSDESDVEAHKKRAHATEGAPTEPGSESFADDDDAVEAHKRRAPGGGD